MKLETFKMERWQSEWEHLVAYNLSESGVHPLSFEELITQDELKDILKTGLGYIQTNGTPELKEEIGRYYPGSNNENIIVTTGSAEANFILMWALLEPGDETIFMLPNFMQIHGLMKAFGADVKTFFLKENLDWNPDLTELKTLVTRKTKVIAITNPNNPTGSQLTEEARQTITDLAKWADAWLISDEVYQGAEFDGNLTESFWGTYRRTLVVSGLSKAYGLPGLRVGWIVGPEDIVKKSWNYKDYTTITISALSDRLARIVLKPEKRQKILERTRKIIRRNFSILDSWMNKQNGFFHCIPPRAGAIAFARYNMDINATELAHRIRKEKGVLIQPGDQFGMDRYIRFGLGEERKDFIKALKLVEEVLKVLRRKV
jgi:aspartate/methionine/tyrosine aminotransferase